MDTREGKGIARHGFRTREEGDLPTGSCDVCEGMTYQVPAGTWLHWSTLTTECQAVPAAVALERPSDGQEGAIS